MLQKWIYNIIHTQHIEKAPGKSSVVATWTGKRYAGSETAHWEHHVAIIFMVAAEVSGTNRCYTGCREPILRCFNISNFKRTYFIAPLTYTRTRFSPCAHVQLTTTTTYLLYGIAEEIVVRRVILCEAAWARHGTARKQASNICIASFICLSFSTSSTTLFFNGLFIFYA